MTMPDVHVMVCMYWEMRPANVDKVECGDCRVALACHRDSRKAATERQLKLVCPGCYLRIASSARRLMHLGQITTPFEQAVPMHPMLIMELTAMVVHHKRHKAQMN